MLNKRGKIAISQIIILVIGIVAIGYAIGSEIRGVEGGGRKPLPEDTYSPTPVESISTNYDGIWAGMGKGFVGNIAQGLWYSAIVVGMIKLFGPMITDNEGAVDAI